MLDREIIVTELDQRSTQESAGAGSDAGMREFGLTSTITRPWIGPTSFFPSMSPSMW